LLRVRDSATPARLSLSGAENVTVATCPPLNTAVTCAGGGNPLTEARDTALSEGLLLKFLPVILMNISDRDMGVTAAYTCGAASTIGAVMTVTSLMPNPLLMATDRACPTKLVGTADPNVITAVVPPPLTVLTTAVRTGG